MGKDVTKIIIVLWMEQIPFNPNDAWIKGSTKIFAFHLFCSVEMTICVHRNASPTRLTQWDFVTMTIPSGLHPCVPIHRRISFVILCVIRDRRYSIETRHDSRSNRNGSYGESDFLVHHVHFKRWSLDTPILRILTRSVSQQNKELAEYRFDKTKYLVLLV